MQVNVTKTKVQQPRSLFFLKNKQFIKSKIAPKTTGKIYSLGAFTMLSAYLLSEKMTIDDHSEVAHGARHHIKLIILTVFIFSFRNDFSLII